MEMAPRSPDTVLFMLSISCFSAYRLSEVLDEPSKPVAESAYSSFRPTSSSSKGSSLYTSLDLILAFTYFRQGGSGMGSTGRNVF